MPEWKGIYGDLFWTPLAFKSLLQLRECVPERHFLLFSQGIPPEIFLMKQVQIGGSELRTSRLAYGCWRIIPGGKAIEVTPDREQGARKAILAALDAGYTMFDHADIYSDGLGEWVFGRWLRDN